MPACHRCGAELPSGKPVRSSLCGNCGAGVHACLNCRHHDRAARQECREPQAEWVRDKDKANFCDWFEPRQDRAQKSGDARSALDALFRK